MIALENKNIIETRHSASAWITHTLICWVPPSLNKASNNNAKQNKTHGLTKIWTFTVDETIFND